MKITNNTTKGRPIFRDIEVGEWFIDADGDIATKLGDWMGSSNNCVYFTREKAVLHQMDAQEYAFPVEVELVITNKR